MEDVEILIDEDGTIQFIYDDDVAAALADDGVASTARASHVEPHPTGDGWIADMGPVGGPYLCADGARSIVDGALWHTVPGFATRRAALDAEIAYLRERMARERVVVFGE